MFDSHLLSFFLVALLGSLAMCQNVTTVKPTTTTTVVTTTTSTTAATTTTQTTKPSLASTCTLNQASTIEKGLLKTVLMLDKKQFTWEDSDHMYYFGVCTQAANAKNVNEAFVQINKKSNNSVVLGRLDDVDIEGFGTESPGIRVHYMHGDTYPNSCNKAERASVVYILCNPNNSSDLFEMIEENNDREGATCGYEFQLRTPLMCKNTTTNETTQNVNKHTKWGFVSIVLLVILGVLFVYFLVGTIYKRYVQQARGIEQLPHHEIWQSLGLKSADCCNYVCRCGKRPSEIRNYEHISDRLSDDDENLLNM